MQNKKCERSVERQKKGQNFEEEQKRQLNRVKETLSRQKKLQMSKKNKKDVLTICFETAKKAETSLKPAQRNQQCMFAELSSKMLKL